MTKLLKKAFEHASQLLEDIEGELLWDDTLAGSQDHIERMADKALEEFRARRTRKMGFDEL